MVIRKKKYDNIYVINKLTHDMNGTVDDECFNAIFDNFEHYRAFKKLLDEFKSYNPTISKTVVDEDTIKFVLTFKKQSYVDNFIARLNSLNFIEKGQEYNAIVKELEHQSIEIYFERNE